MAGMNLNPYNLNNNEGPVNKKLYSNHYSGDKNYNNEEEKTEVPKEVNPYLKTYGFKTTNPKDMDLNKTVAMPQKPNYSLFIGLGVGLIILLILLALL